MAGGCDYCNTIVILLTIVGEYMQEFDGGITPNDNPSMGPYVPPLDGSSATADLYGQQMAGLLGGIPGNKIWDALLSVMDPAAFFRNNYLENVGNYNQANGYNREGTVYLRNIVPTPVDSQSFCDGLDGWTFEGLCEDAVSELGADLGFYVETSVWEVDESLDGWYAYTLSEIAPAEGNPWWMDLPTFEVYTY